MGEKRFPEFEDVFRRQGMLDRYPPSPHDREGKLRRRRRPEHNVKRELRQKTCRLILPRSRGAKLESWSRLMNHAPDLDYCRQPEGCQLRCIFLPHGVRIIDESQALPTARRQGRDVTILTLNDGRITIEHPTTPDAAPYRFLRDRHVGQMRVIGPRLFGLVGTSCLRIWLSDMTIDLFKGLPVPELIWIVHTLHFELEKHRERKRMAPVGKGAIE
jgi:hypothetical protein